MFKINYQLKKPQEIEPWGETEKVLHWFGLTDSLLWINAGDSVIYEYSEEAVKEFGIPIKYNDYQLSRFLEDFSDILPYVSESLPEFLYDSVENFSKNIRKWNLQYIEKSDEEYDHFFDALYEPLDRWFYDRTFDSGHLVGGPRIGCFRCGDNIKIYWESDYSLKDGSSIWKNPKGLYEMKYADFVSEVSRFFESFAYDMDKQTADVQKNGIKGVFVDIDSLSKENELRKEIFSEKVRTLYSEKETNTDWSQVKHLYDKMIMEI